MQKFFIILLVLLAACGTLSVKGMSYYRNDRFGFSVSVPQGMGAVPEPANGDGWELRDDATAFTIIASGVYNRLFGTALEEACMDFKGISPVVTYPDASLASDVIIRWEDKGFLYWRRVILIQGDDENDAGRFIKVHISYPEKNGEICKPIAEAVIASLKAADKKDD